MQNEVSLRIQVIDLEHLLEEAKDDPILSRQLEQRVRAATNALEAVNTELSQCQRGQCNAIGQSLY